MDMFSLKSFTHVARLVPISDIKTKPKVLIAAAVPLLMAVLIGGLALVNLSRIEQTQGRVDYTQGLMSESSAIVASAVDMETGLRGYILAGQTGFLRPYIMGNSKVFSALQNLQETVADNPAQVERLQEATTVLRSWQTNVADPMIALRRQIGDAKSMNDIAQAVRAKSGEDWLKRFRDLMTTFITAQNELLADHSSQLNGLLSADAVNLVEVRDVINATNRLQSVISHAKDLQAAVVDMEAGMSGFLVAGDEEFLAPFETGMARFEASLKNLQTTVADAPSQGEVLVEAEQVIDNWLQTSVTPMLELRRQIGNSETMDDMADTVAEGRGKAYFDNFRQIMADFSEEEAAIMVQRRQSNDATFSWTVSIVWAALVATVLIGLITSLSIGSSIGAAIKELTSRMVQLANGDTSVEITGQNRRDEIGEMARATEVFKKNAIRVTSLNEQREADAKHLADMAADREKAAKRDLEIAKEREEADHRRAEEREKMMSRLESSFGAVVESAVLGEFSKRVDMQFEDKILNDLATDINQLMTVIDRGVSETGKVLQRVADGDLSTKMDGSYNGDFASLQTNVNSMIDALKSLIGDISGSGDFLETSSTELSEVASYLSMQAEGNAASLEETSAALEELAASITQVSTNVDEASKNARLTRDTARSSEAVAVDAAASMQRIAEASKEISRVVGIINEIAFQINLLALNAGVEAARAGEAGRGFSVVASEVRDLAQRASDAAAEIATVISKSDEAVNEGVAKVDNARSSLEAIADSVIKISSEVDAVSDAITEQASGITEITSAVSHIDQNTQKQSAFVEQVSATSAVLAAEADSLQKSIAAFDIEIGSTEVHMQTRQNTDTPTGSIKRELTESDVSGMARDVSV